VHRLDHTRGPLGLHPGQERLRTARSAAHHAPPWASLVLWTAWPSGWTELAVCCLCACSCSLTPGGRICSLWQSLLIWASGRDP